MDQTEICNLNIHGYTNEKYLCPQCCSIALKISGPIKLRPKQWPTILSTLRLGVAARAAFKALTFNSVFHHWLSIVKYWRFGGKDARRIARHQVSVRSLT